MKRLLLLVSMCFLFFSSVCRGDLIDIEDGSAHRFDDNTYQNHWVRLDYSVSNTPGTHVDLVGVGSVADLYAWNNSSVTMTGGTVGGELSGYGNSSISISGGSVGSRLYACDNSNIHVSGGSVGYAVRAYQEGTITISGGAVTGELRSYQDGNILLYGTDFEVDGKIVGYGDKLSDFVPLFENGDQDYYAGTVTGLLADGSALNIEFRIYNTGSNAGDGDIKIVPEPGTVLLVGLGAFGLLRKRRR